MDLGIKGKTALVVGGDSGLGLATAKTLLEEEATVIITGVDQEKLEEAADSLKDYSHLYHYYADVTKSESLKKLHQQIQKDVGKIDILVHSAGISGTSGLFHEISESDWQETLDVDLMGAVRTIKEFLSDLRTGGWGRLILISSENAEEAYPDEIPYDCAKAGLLALVKGLSKTYAKEGLLVNAVSPAFIETPMTDAMMEERSKELKVSKEEAIQSFLDEKRPNIELKRRGQPEEVAAVIAFLCSDRASFINGSNYRIDAGSVSTI
ncbi:SDR family oxidoreductase [Desemzia sp. RIT804]|uniref:SDR family NAD(P)-dependent oxidoreductase n=1 Tax=Desemzia sp. RIT 804 TaxID=2810209 RepID=UPI0019521043|nr:SDR family oxidoreductase [Desemzia sp. RIT 804]MBM6615494.1 SDR family oxidoreductase [Desemzia sp. RIT 804]